MTVKTMETRDEYSGLRLSPRPLQYLRSSRRAVFIHIYRPAVERVQRIQTTSSRRDKRQFFRDALLRRVDLLLRQYKFLRKWQLGKNNGQ